MANPSKKGTLQGLCGNFNGKVSDDKKEFGGIMANSITTFVNSWRTNDQCADAREIEPCDDHKDRAAWATKGIL